MNIGVEENTKYEKVMARKKLDPDHALGVVTVVKVAHTQENVIIKDQRNIKRRRVDQKVERRMIASIRKIEKQRKGRSGGMMMIRLDHLLVVERMARMLREV